MVNEDTHPGHLQGRPQRWRFIAASFFFVLHHDRLLCSCRRCSLPRAPPLPGASGTCSLDAPSRRPSGTVKKSSFPRRRRLTWETRTSDRRLRFMGKTVSSFPRRRRLTRETERADTRLRFVRQTVTVRPERGYGSWEIRFRPSLANGDLPGRLRGPIDGYGSSDRRLRLIRRRFRPSLADADVPGNSEVP